MTKDFTRRSVLTALAGFAAGPALANAPDWSLRPQLRPDGFHKRSVGGAYDAIARANLKGDVAFIVMDAANDEVLETYNPDVTLPPASVAKAITASYALKTLGPGHHFVTQVMATGTVIDGIVSGDLVLVGGGDPTLNTDVLADLAAQVKAAGVREVRGKLLVWGGALPFSRLIDPGQPEQVGYNPAISGMNLNFNRVHFEWRRDDGDWAVTMDARTKHYRPDVHVAQMQVVARKAPIYTYQDADGRDNWTVARGALGNGGARWLPVRKPEIYAGEVFQTLLGAQGIRVSAPKVTQDDPHGALLARNESAPLRIILRDMLKYSTNLTAEAVGMAASTKRLGRVESLRASAAEMSAWAKAELGLSSIDFVDHSGLGDGSRICPRDMALALSKLRRQIGLKPLLKPVVMPEGSQADVRAKTGTLNFVSGLAGYIDTPDERELVFAVFAADLPRRDGLSRAERERPPGARGWNGRAKTLQKTLIERWTVLYGT